MWNCWAPEWEWERERAAVSAKNGNDGNFACNYFVAQIECNLWVELTIKWCSLWAGNRFI